MSLSAHGAASCDIETSQASFLEVNAQATETDSLWPCEKLCSKQLRPFDAAPGEPFGFSGMSSERDRQWWRIRPDGAPPRAPSSSRTWPGTKGPSWSFCRGPGVQRSPWRLRRAICFFLHRNNLITCPGAEICPQNGPSYLLKLPHNFTHVSSSETSQKSSGFPCDLFKAPGEVSSMLKLQG